LVGRAGAGRPRVHSIGTASSQRQEGDERRCPRGPTARQQSRGAPEQRLPHPSCRHRIRHVRLPCSRAHHAVSVTAETCTKCGRIEEVAASTLRPQSRATIRTVDLGRFDRLYLKLFLVIAGAIAGLTLVSYLVFTWTFERGFVHYVNRADDARLELMTDRL